MRSSKDALKEDLGTVGVGIDAGTGSDMEDQAIHVDIAGAKEVAELTSKTFWTVHSIIFNLVDIIVGICFITLGIIQVIDIFQFEEIVEEEMEDLGYKATAYDWISAIAAIVGGSIMVLNPRRTFNISIGIYAMTMGVISLMSILPEVLAVDPGGASGGILGILSDFMYLAQFFMMCLSINLMYSGVSYLRGRPRGTVGMMFKAAFLMFMGLFSLMLGVKMGDYDTVLVAFRENPDTVISTLLFFIFLNMMDTDEARAYNPKVRLKNSTDAMRRTHILNERSRIWLSDAKVLTDRTFQSWTRLDDGGPAEYEFRFFIRCREGDSYVIVQRWKGQDKYFFTIMHKQMRSVLRANRFVINDIQLSEDLSTLDFLSDNFYHKTITVSLPLDMYEVQKKEVDAE